MGRKNEKYELTPAGEFPDFIQDEQDFNEFLAELEAEEEEHTWQQAM